MMLFVGALILIAFLCNQVVAQDEEKFQCHELFEYDATNKGEFTSPFYEKGAYPTGLWCEYKITAPEGFRIKITFKDLDISPSGGCSNDQLVVYGKDKASILGMVCGDEPPNPILSNEGESEVRFLFRTDYMSSGRGFRIQYESGPNLSLCSEAESECKNRNCYSSEKRCDGVDDCGDGTDEEKCGKPVAFPSHENCGDTPIQPITQSTAPDRQVGGVEATPNSWPWQVSLQRNYAHPNGHFCGGSLISPQWVVTAAHCVVGMQNPSDVKIVLGSHNKFKKSKYEVIRYGEKIISYPDLEGERLRNMNINHDISLIKLNAPVVFTDGIQPACLPALGWEAPDGMLCYATGWGETRGSGFSDVLKQTKETIQSRQECSFDTHTQICVDQRFQSPCHGDSGGPLACKFGSKWYVMGATSFGTRSNFMDGLCGVQGNKVIFSKVSDKDEWIRKLIQLYS